MPGARGLVGAGGPPLHVGHLDPGRRVDPVRRLEQAGEEDRVERRAGEVGLDRLPDRVDPRAVEGLEVASGAAEGLGEVAGLARQARQVVERSGSSPWSMCRRRSRSGSGRGPRSSARVSIAVTRAPRRLNSWATRVVPVNRSRAERAPERSRSSPSTGTRRRLEPRYLITGARRARPRWSHRPEPSPSRPGPAGPPRG